MRDSQRVKVKVKRDGEYIRPKMLEMKLPGRTERKGVMNVTRFDTVG